MDPRVLRIEGEMFRFHVIGITGDYLVDLEENQGLGWCGCPDFEFNRQLAINTRSSTEQHEDDWYRCKHLKICRAELGLELLDTRLALRRKELHALTNGGTTQP